MCFPFIWCLSKCFQTSLMWCTWVRTNHICSNQNGIFWYSSYVLNFIKKITCAFDILFRFLHNWFTKNSEIFSVGVPQFEITGFPGTSNNFLWVLRSRGILPRLVVFLYLHVKYWSFFSDIIPLAFKYLKKWLLFLQFS